MVYYVVYSEFYIGVMGALSAVIYTIHALLARVNNEMVPSREGPLNQCGLDPMVKERFIKSTGEGTMVKEDVQILNLNFAQ